MFRHSQAATGPAINTRVYVSALCLMASTAFAQAPIEERRFGEPAAKTPLVKAPAPAATTFSQAQPRPSSTSVPAPEQAPTAESFPINAGERVEPLTPLASPATSASAKPAAATSQPMASTSSNERRAVVLLPTRAPAFEKAARSVRAGITAAAERASGDTRWQLEFIDTTEATGEITDAFAQAQISNADLVIGPLTRAGVNAALEVSIARPTVLLNAPENESTVLRGPVLAFALSLDSEARRLGILAFDSAQQALPVSSTRKPRALIVQTNQPLYRRIATGFADSYTRAGGSIETIEINLGTVSSLSARVRSGFDSAFLAMDASTARMARPFLPRELAIWGTSQLNTGRDADLTELHGVRFSDMPWKLAADHTAVMAYAKESTDVDDARLYAFGIDAFRLGVELMLGKTDITLDGVTGRLSARVGQRARVEREAMPAMVRSGQIVNLQ